MPMSTVLIGTNGICYQQNGSNVDLNEAYDPSVITSMKARMCDPLDGLYMSYSIINSIPDATYYKLNNVSLNIANASI